MSNETNQKIKRYAEEVLIGAARYYDQMQEFPEEHVKKMFGMAFFEELYSAPDNEENYAAYLERLRFVSRHFPALASILLTQESHVLWPLFTFGTPAQRAEYLPLLLSGKNFGSFALNEEHVGSNYYEMTTFAKPVANGWEITGEKQYISNAPIANIFLVATKVIDNEKERYAIFILNKDSVGLKIGDTEEKIGIKALPVASVSLSGCFVSKQHLLGGDFLGEEQIYSILQRVRLAVSAQAIGISEGAMTRGLEYVSRKRNIGKRLIDLPSTQFKFAEIETKIYTANALLNHVVKTNPTDEHLVAMAKLTASDGAIEVTETIINLTGGYGYMKNNDLERFVRDAKVTAIYGSSSERLKKVIAKPWMKHH